MNHDFRINVSFFTHPKTKRLRRRHGDTALICLQRLWAFAAQHRCKGLLYDMTRDDIVDASEWPGDGEFVDSLAEFGFLDLTDHGYELHDWREHNGYAYHAQERSEKARDAASARWKMRGKSNA